MADLATIAPRLAAARDAYIRGQELVEREPLMWHNIYGAHSDARCRTCGEGVHGGVTGVLRWSNAHRCKPITRAEAEAIASERSGQP